LTPETWEGQLNERIARFSEICRRVDPTSTEQALEQVESETMVDD
jgi:hypothetical protein